jgi:hypothetical protein
MIMRRCGKQIRERWHNELDPTNRKDPWSSEEDERLLAAFHVMAQAIPCHYP